MFLASSALIWCKVLDTSLILNPSILNGCFVPTPAKTYLHSQKYLQTSILDGHLVLEQLRKCPRAFRTRSSSCWFLKGPSSTDSLASHKILLSNFWHRVRVWKEIDYEVVHPGRMLCPHLCKNLSSFTKMTINVHPGRTFDIETAPQISEDILNLIF